MEPDVAERIADLIPNAELSMYPEGGHSLFWNASDRFNRELREFASGVE